MSLTPLLPYTLTEEQIQSHLSGPPVYTYAEMWVELQRRFPHATMQPDITKTHKKWLDGTPLVPCPTTLYELCAMCVAYAMPVVLTWSSTMVRGTTSLPLLCVVEHIPETQRCRCTTTEEPRQCIVRATLRSALLPLHHYDKATLQSLYNTLVGETEEEKGEEEKEGGGGGGGERKRKHTKPQLYEAIVERTRSPTYFP